MLNFKVTILSFFVIIIIFNKSFPRVLAKEKNLIKSLMVFTKIISLNVSISINHGVLDLKDHPYGMNYTAFSDVLVFEYKSMIGTLWPNIRAIYWLGESKNQLWKKMSKSGILL